VSAVTFPFTPTAIEHRHGGTITLITGIGHTVNRPTQCRSRDVWYFVGDVTWSDATRSKGVQILPNLVCYGSAQSSKAQVDDLMNALNDYLTTHGQWCERASRHEGWYANKRGAS
jgi:hypothetical protein